MPATLVKRQFCRISITDNGIGFEPKYAKQIFDLFQRLHNRSTYTGTGIGLAIVQKVIDSHNSYIRAEGRPNNGATFVVVMPLKQF